MTRISLAPDLEQVSDTIGLGRRDGAGDGHSRPPSAWLLPGPSRARGRARGKGQGGTPRMGMTVLRFFHAGI